MEDNAKLMEVFVDFLPNQPRTEQTRETFRQLLRDGFERSLASTVERMWDLPPVIVKRHGDYLEMLLEARELYIRGFFYSCVAMSGVVGERLVKDMLRASLLIQKSGSAAPPSGEAFDQLERVEISGIIRFLKEAGLLGSTSAKAASALSELRNQYAHARGKQPRSDALCAIKHLHELVEDTVSVLKEYEIRRGVFVPKEDDCRSPSGGA